VIVADSSFVIAFYNNRDSHHEAAKEWMRMLQAGQWGRGILLEYGLLETLTVLMSRRGPEFARSVGRLLYGAHDFDLLPCSGFLADTLEFFLNQTQTRLSFADAAMAFVALHYADGKILTFDEEFRKISGLMIP
jgi:predicted nucleic acid-binding protein